MKYKENTQTGQVIEYNDKTFGSSFRKAPWIDSTKTKYDDYEKSKDLKVKKEKKTEEKRQAYIDSQIQTELDAIDNAVSEEELNGISL